MATTSQKMILVLRVSSGALLGDTTYEIKFLVLILGARTPPPKMDAPVTKIPLRPHISPVSSPFPQTNSPCGAGYAETDTEADTNERPCIRGRLCEKAADVECLSLPFCGALYELAYDLGGRGTRTCEEEVEGDEGGGGSGG